MEKNFAKEFKITDKRFWQNYWFYYKVHTWVGLIVIIVIISSIVSCVRQVHPDISIMAVTEAGIAQEKSDAMTANFEAVVEDANGDGNRSVSFLTMMYNENMDGQTAAATLTKADLEIMAGETNLLLVDDQFLTRYADMEAFEDITVHAQEAGIPQERLKTDAEGKVYAVELTDTNFAKELGYTGEHLYVGIKVLSEPNRKKEEEVNNYNASLKVLDWILADDMNVEQPQ